VTVVIKASSREVIENKEHGVCLRDRADHFMEVGCIVFAIEFGRGETIEQAVFDHDMLTLFVSGPCGTTYKHVSCTNGIFVSWQPHTFQELCACLGRVFDGAEINVVNEAYTIFKQLCKTAFPISKAEQQKESRRDTLKWLSALHDMLGYTVSVCPKETIAYFNQRVAATFENGPRGEETRLPLGLSDYYGEKKDYHLQTIDAFENALRQSGTHTGYKPRFG